MRLQLQAKSYRDAQGLLGRAPNIVEELERILLNPELDLALLSRSHFNQTLKEAFVASGWQNHPSLFNEPVNPLAKIELVKETIGLELGFRHISYTGFNLLKFQLSCQNNLDKIDVGIFVVTTLNFQKQIKKTYHQNWAGAMNFEKVDRYLRNFTTTIQTPIYLIGIDAA